MLSPQWVTIILTGLVMLGGTAINLFIIGRFVGQWGETMRTTTSALVGVQAEIRTLRDESEDHSSNARLMDQRLQVVEEATSKFWAMREEFVAMRAVAELTSKQTSEQLASMGRTMAGIERQLGNLFTSKGFHRIESQPPGE